MTNHPNRSLTSKVLAELADRYTTLPDDYRRYVQDADTATLREVLALARADAPGRQIVKALGYSEREFDYWYPQS